MTKIKCVVSGQILFSGLNKTYVFTDDTPQEVNEEDLNTMLQLKYVTGGCCGTPLKETPYFITVE